MPYGHMQHATIADQIAEAERLHRESAKNLRATQEEEYRNDPLYTLLEAERAAHAVTAAKLEAALKGQK